MFLIMVPFDVPATFAPIDHNIAPIEVVVTEPANFNGKPIGIAPGVKLTMTDGFTVTMSAESAAVAVVPNVESDEEYAFRLCLQYVEAKPWLGETC